MSELILTLNERIADVRCGSINNFQTYYELAVLLVSII